MIAMKYPIRNLMYEKIMQARTMTDTDLMNALAKDGVTLSDSDFNKTLMDLEIYGLVRVSWVTKDKRRIELLPNSSTAPS
jgi:DNA-binding PadR family transcriptional regulator